LNIEILVHKGNPGNATADFLAKLSTMHSTTEACSLISHHCLQLWNEEYIQTSRQYSNHLGYKLFCPDIDTTQTKIPITTAIFLLGTGHCRLHSHLHKIRLHPDGLCDTCDIPETVEHFLMQSGKYAEARHKLQRSIQNLNINFDQGSATFTTQRAI